MNNTFNIDEAVCSLSAYSLEEVQKVLGLSDDDVVNLLLDDCEAWHQKILSWYAKYLHDTIKDEAEKRYEDR
ncbi:MAG: hypothetical protein WAM24_11605 [Ignavibacteriaceae bacterium]